MSIVVIIVIVIVIIYSTDSKINVCLHGFKVVQVKIDSCDSDDDDSVYSVIISSKTELVDKL